MQSLQHHARLTVCKNYIDYSHVIPHTCRSVGLPNVEIIKRMQRENTKDPNDGLQIAAEMGCMHSLLFCDEKGSSLWPY